MPFASFKKMLEDAAGKGGALFAKVKDKPTFERVVMACYLIGMADGSFDPDEKQAVAKLINKKFPQFTISDIQAVIAKADDKLSFDLAMGQQELMAEIAKAKGDDAEMIVQAACFIGAADGDFDYQEKTVVRQLVERMGLNARNYGLA